MAKDTSIKILSVDDEQKDLAALDKICTEKKITLRKTSGAEEALTLLKAEHIDIIFSANLMPHMTGLQFLELVKNRYPGTLRILMTPKADIFMELDAINQCELFHIIAKPLKDHVLIKAIDDAEKRLKIAGLLKHAAADEAKLLDLAQSIELKDPYTKDHCERVGKYALLIAGALNLTQEVKRQIKYGSWLHDCGKIDLPAVLLNFEGTLNENQFKVVELHTQWGADIARQAELPETIANIIQYHHESFDGTGYPKGLSGTDIPLEVRIVTVAEVYDVVTSDRPYRKA
ncbi:MAG: HD domain-containing phosphohydrolase, partial [Pseudomonadota bacterium]